METDGFLGILPKYTGKFCGAVLYIIPSLNTEKRQPTGYCITCCPTRHKEALAQSHAFFAIVFFYQGLMNLGKAASSDYTLSEELYWLYCVCW